MSVWMAKNHFWSWKFLKILKKNTSKTYGLRSSMRQGGCSWVCTGQKRIGIGVRIWIWIGTVSALLRQRRLDDSTEGRLVRHWIRRTTHRGGGGWHCGQRLKNSIKQNVRDWSELLLSTRSISCSNQWNRNNRRFFSRKSSSSFLYNIFDFKLYELPREKRTKTNFK